MQGVLQHLNADIATKDDNNMNSVASRERTNSNIPVGLWTPMNNSFVLQHLKIWNRKKQSMYFSKRDMESTIM